MSGTVWTKFFWSDWDSDPALRLCSFAAQGLWMRMLCIAASHDPIGYVAVAGRALDETSIARMTGGEECEVRSLLGELERNGVFSRDRHRRIYSRRMVADAKKVATAQKNGRKGGNPSLRTDEGFPPRDNPPDNPGVKGGDKPQEPEARSQKPERTPKPPGASLSAAVEAIWSAAPEPSRRRSSRRLLGEALAAAIKRGRPLPQVEAAMLACLASPDATREGGKYVAAVHRLVHQERFEGFLVACSNQSPGVPEWQQRAWMDDWRESPASWRRHERGPAPGEDGCRISSAIQAEGRADLLPFPAPERRRA